MSRPDRRGYALISVLGTLAIASTLALTATLVAREAVQAARNRADLIVAAWQAEDCIERFRAATAQALDRAAPDDAMWVRLDSVGMASDLLGPRCSLAVRPIGARVSVNALDQAATLGLLAALAVPPEAADSLTDALLDWRDADEMPRALGAERDWYSARDLPLPRNGPIADLRELRRVRGWDRLAGLDSILSMDPARIALSHAPSAVWATLPGITPEVVSVVAERRARGESTTDLTELLSRVTPAAQAEAFRHHGLLLRLTTPEPVGWLVHSHASVGEPPISRVLEVEILRSGTGGALGRRRGWTE